MWTLWEPGNVWFRFFTSGPWQSPNTNRVPSLGLESASIPSGAKHSLGSWVSPTASPCCLEPCCVHPWVSNHIQSINMYQDVKYCNLSIHHVIYSPLILPVILGSQNLRCPLWIYGAQQKEVRAHGDFAVRSLPPRLWRWWANWMGFHGYSWVPMLI